MFRSDQQEAPARTAGANNRPTDGFHAARCEAALELIARHESTLRRTARRYSLCSDDAEDAYQRALEILLTKAPTTEVGDLIRWMQIVTKHEALAVRKQRERMLGRPAASGYGEGEDWVGSIPSDRDGPADQVERRERVERSREALQALKPHELRALTLLAEGYSYLEISETTGWSRTKINRLLAEGRQRFRDQLSRRDDGRRCDELGGALSAFCDGEASSEQETELREHLRACPHCRAKLRTFRAAPQAAAALAPILPLSRSLWERCQELAVGVQSRLPGRTGAGDTAASQVAIAGGSRGAGAAVLAKVLAACVGTAGGTAACVAAGVFPAPIDFGLGVEKKPAIERRADSEPAEQASYSLPPDPTADEVPPTPIPDPEPTQVPEPETAPPEPEAPEPTPVETEFSAEAAGTPVASPPVDSPSSGPASAGGAVPLGGGGGEFGP